MDLHVEKRKQKILSGLEKAQRISSSSSLEAGGGSRKRKQRILSLKNDVNTRQRVKTQLIKTQVMDQIMSTASVDAAGGGTAVHKAAHKKSAHSQ